jgi:hypothetical protein
MNNKKKWMRRKVLYSADIPNVFIGLLVNNELERM